MTLPTQIPATEYLPLVRDAVLFVLVLGLLWLALLSPWLLLVRGSRQGDEAALDLQAERLGTTTQRKTGPWSTSLAWIEPMCFACSIPHHGLGVWDTWKRRWRAGRCHARRHRNC